MNLLLFLLIGKLHFYTVTAEDELKVQVEPGKPIPCFGYVIEGEKPEDDDTCLRQRCYVNKNGQLPDTCYDLKKNP